MNASESRLLDFQMAKKNLKNFEPSMGSSQAFPSDPTGLKNIDGFDKTDEVASMVSKESGNVHGYTPKEQSQGFGYGEGYNQTGNFGIDNIPIHGNDINEAAFDLDLYKEEMQHIPKFKIPKNLSKIKKKSGPRKKSGARKKSGKVHKKARSKAKRDLKKARRTLKLALTRYNKVMKL